MPTRKSVHPSKYQEVSNRNFLSVVGFKFVLERCPKVDFYCNGANLPEITLGVAEQASYLRNIPVPGDKLQFDDLRLSFMVDENMENYLQIYRWITALGYPESIGQYSKLWDKERLLPELDTIGTAADVEDEFNERSDGTLMILSNTFNPTVKVKFRDLFPTSLSGIPFDNTKEQQEYYTASVSFKYTMFDVIDIDGKKV